MADAEVKKVLIELLAAKGVAVDDASFTQSLTGLGLDSLHVVELQLELEQAFGIELGEGDQLERALGTMPLKELLATVEDRVRRAQGA